MERAELEQRTTEIIVEHLGVEESRVTPDTLLVPEAGLFGGIKPDGKPSLEADSLDIVELVMAFEVEFNVEIDDDDAERLQTASVKELFDFLDERVD